MAEAVLIQRPQRWDNPFDSNMSEEDVDHLLTIEPFCDMDPAKFPPVAALRDIIRNDTRIHRFLNGDISVRMGDYGNSAFLVLKGSARVVLNPPLPDRVLGRQTAAKKGHFEALSQLWRNASLPEVRDPARYESLLEESKRRREERPARTARRPESESTSDGSLPR